MQKIQTQNRNLAIICWFIIVFICSYAILGCSPDDKSGGFTMMDSTQNTRYLTHLRLRLHWENEYLFSKWSLNIFNYTDKNATASTNFQLLRGTPFMCVCSLKTKDGFLIQTLKVYSSDFKEINKENNWYIYNLEKIPMSKKVYNSFDLDFDDFSVY